MHNTDQRRRRIWPAVIAASGLTCLHNRCASNSTGLKPQTRHPPKQPSCVGLAPTDNAPPVPPRRFRSVHNHPLCNQNIRLPHHIRILSIRSLYRHIANMIHNNNPLTHLRSIPLQAYASLSHTLPARIFPDVSLTLRAELFLLWEYISASRETAPRSSIIPHKTKVYRIYDTPPFTHKTTLSKPSHLLSAGVSPPYPLPA